VARRNLDYCHVMPTRDETDTVDAILSSDPNCDILVGPTHHFDADGVFCGFRVCYPPHTTGVQLPINRKMFYGVTMIEASSFTGVNENVITLVSDKVKYRKAMYELMKEIDEESRGNEPSLECMPQNVDTVHRGYSSKGSNVIGVRDHRAVDSKPWSPEVPEFIGVYHTYTRGYNKDSREHRMYLACGGGCSLAANAYYNLLLDIGSQTDVDEIADSEETWWLRNAAYRTRCRVLHRLAKKFGLSVPTITDMHSYDNVPMARSTTDTLWNDISRLRSGHIGVFNTVVDTTTSKNGVINTMHPNEGLWVFKGPTRSSHGLVSLGAGFGDQRKCGVFPVASFKVAGPGNTKHGTKHSTKHSTSRANNGAQAENHGDTVGNGRATPKRNITTIVSKPTEDVVFYETTQNTERTTEKSVEMNSYSEYIWYDEAFMRTLESMGYDRNCGMLELMPIIVGVSV
jgi:hypothetical protein